jgi:hypothetical protein
LQAAALLLGCVAAGRTVGLVADGFASETVTAIVVEVIMIAVLLLTARRMTSPA